MAPVKSEPLFGWLAERCAALARMPSLRPERDLLADIAVHATEPLRVAVTGDVSTGKSTLVNALVGQDLARVQREETTAEVTWFRNPDVAVPPPLSAAHHCRSIAFRLGSILTLADTPGVNSGSGAQKETEAMLAASTGAAGSATVLIYLCVNGANEGALRRIRAFSAASSGLLDEGTSVVLCGSKADEDWGCSREQRDAYTAYLRGQAGRFGTHAVAVAPILASSARTGKVDQRLIRQLALIASMPGWADAVTIGWPLLRTMVASAGLEREVDVDYLYLLSNTTVGIGHAAELVQSKVREPVPAIRRLWQDMSGLDDLEALLRKLAADRDTLTVPAVAGRLRRLAARLGTELGAPVRAICEELNRHPGMAGYERRAAAMLLENDTLSLRRVPVAARQSAAAFLRGTRPSLPAESLREWRRRSNQPGQSALAQRVAWIVAEAARCPGPAIQGGHDALA